MPKQINCGICAIGGEKVIMKLNKGYFECLICNAELWFVNETNQTIKKMINGECGLRNDQHEKLNNIKHRASGSFESNFK